MEKTNVSGPIMAHDRIKSIAYKVFEGFNDFDVTDWDVKQAMEYMYRRILPYQINQNLQRLPKVRFEVVIPPSLSEVAE